MKIRIALALFASILALSACSSPMKPVEPIQEKPISYPGNDIDAQEGELRAFLEGQNIPYVRQGANAVISLPEGITFATNSAAIKPQAKTVLNKLATIFDKYRQTTINVIGHTDSTGSDAINDKLSLDRAQSVATIFKDKGLGAFRVNPVGAGSKNPVASNDTAEGRAKNRRVEIVLSPLQLKR